MTKVTDPTRFRSNGKTRKAPTYTPRELKAIAAADRIVARIIIAGEWKEMEFWPLEGQSVRSRLAEIQNELSGNRSLAKVCLYVGGMVDGERMIANVPHNLIPEELVG